MRLSRFSIRHPKTALVGVLAQTLAVAPGINRFCLRTVGHALVPAEAQAIQVDRRIREEFGVHDPVVLFIRSTHADGIFNNHTLTLVQELTDDLKQFPGNVAVITVSSQD